MQFLQKFRVARVGHFRILPNSLLMRKEAPARLRMEPVEEISSRCCNIVDGKFVGDQLTLREQRGR